MQCLFMGRRFRAHYLYRVLAPNLGKQYGIILRSDTLRASGSLIIIIYRGDSGPYRDANIQ